MRIVKRLGAVVCALVALGFLATATLAQAQAQEPHYLRALSDLPTAREYIQYDRGQFDGARHHAVGEINKAIDEIKHAAWDDGKNTAFAPPTQGVRNGWAPMHQAHHFIDLARGRVAEGIDTPQNQGLRDRILLHIDEARGTIQRILQAGAQ